MKELNIDVQSIIGISSFVNDKNHEIVGFTLNLKNGEIKNILISYHKNQELVNLMSKKYSQIKRSICTDRKKK